MPRPRHQQIGSHRRKRHPSPKVVIPGHSAQYSSIKSRQNEVPSDRLANSVASMALNSPHSSHVQHINLPTPPITPPSRSALWKNRRQADVSHVRSQIDVSKRTKRGHRWSIAERQVICLAKRLLKINIVATAKILNIMFQNEGTHFRPGMVNAQYVEMKTGLGTADSQIAFASIWACSLAEVAVLFHGVITEIERAGERAEITLERRDTDNPADLRAARSVRGRNAALFDSAKPRLPVIIDLTRAQSPPIEIISSRESSVTLLADGDKTFQCGEHSTSPAWESSAARSRIDGPPTTNSGTGENSYENSLDITKFHPKNIPPLLTRFFSPKSAGINSSQIIRAAKFSSLPTYPILRHPSVNGVLWETTNHLSRCRVPTALISTSNSLIWVLHRALREKGPLRFIAVINGVAAHERTTVLHATPILRELRSRKMFEAQNIRSDTNPNTFLKMCRYSGSAEFLVYGEITAPALMNVIPFDCIQQLAEKSPAVSRFLRLEALENSSFLLGAVRKMERNPIILNSESALAVAKITLLFGISSQSEESILTSFIFMLLQNWKIEIPNHEANIQLAKRSFITTFCTLPRVVTDATTVEKVEMALKNAIDFLVYTRS